MEKEVKVLYKLLKEKESTHKDWYHRCVNAGEDLLANVHLGRQEGFNEAAALVKKFLLEDKD